MQIIPLDLPPPPPGSPYGPRCGWLSPRHLIARAGADLALGVIEGGAVTWITTLPEIAAWSCEGSWLAVAQADGQLRVLRLEGDALREVHACRAPAELVGFSPPMSVKAAPDGAALLLLSQPIPTGPHTWSVSRAALIGADDGSVRRTLNLHIAGLSADFIALPEGRQGLLIAAESYMGVLLLDAATGETLHGFDPGSNSFCHVSFELLRPDVLWTFGCFWAAPYEARLYDLAPWLTPPGGEVVSGAFPLPLLHEERNRDGLDNLVLGARPLLLGDDAILLSTINLVHLPRRGSPADLELREDAEADTLTLLDSAQELAAQGRTSALLASWVGLGAAAQGQGQVRLVGVGPTEEQNVFSVDARRVVLVHELVEVVDLVAGLGHIVGANPMAGARRPWASLSPDGQTLVVGASSSG